MDSKKIAQEIALLSRQKRETKNATLKAAIDKKLARLKIELEDSKLSTSELARKLLRAKQNVQRLSAADFSAIIKRLSKRSEYHFLKHLTKQEIKDDLKRQAKPVGYRFRGRGNYKVPTKQQIIDGKKNGTVYYENRSNRADVSRAVQLEKGGTIVNLKVDDMIWDQNGKKMEVNKVEKTHYILASFKDHSGTPYDKKIVHEKLQSGEWTRKPKMETGGTIPNNYKGKTPQQIWNAWSVDQRTHFFNDHMGENYPKSAAKQKWSQLLEDEKDLIAEHIFAGQYNKGGNVKKVINDDEIVVKDASSKQTKAQTKKIEKVMREYKDGEFTTHAKKVTNRKQAVAIALSEASVSKKGWNHKKPKK